MIEKDKSSTKLSPSEQLLELETIAPFVLDVEQPEEMRAFFKEKKQDEKHFPILKETVESRKINQCIGDFARYKIEYIQTLEYVPLQAALTQWLNELDSNRRRKYAKYVEDMKKIGIYPNFDVGGLVYSIGHFRRADHEENINHIKTLRDSKNIIECYNSFLYYLEFITMGWIKKDRPLLILNLQLAHSDSKITEWFNFALNDFYTAQDQSQGHPTTYRSGLTSLQQSAEKGLKTFLLYNGEKINKTHDLKELLEQCALYDEKILRFKKITELNPYAVKLRYPGTNIHASKELEILTSQIRNVHQLLLYLQTLMINVEKYTKSKKIRLLLITRKACQGLIKNLVNVLSFIKRLLLR